MVRDSGVGIKPQDLLSISRSIIEAHGGRIWAKTNDGPALTLTVSLPAENERSS